MTKTPSREMRHLQPSGLSAEEGARENVALAHRLAEAVERAPESNALLIQCLKEAVARDDYVVNAQRVADRMIRFERQLAGPPKRVR